MVQQQKDASHPANHYRRQTRTTADRRSETVAWKRQGEQLLSEEEEELETVLAEEHC